MNNHKNKNDIFYNHKNDEHIFQTTGAMRLSGAVLSEGRFAAALGGAAGAQRLARAFSVPSRALGGQKLGGLQVVGSGKIARFA